MLKQELRARLGAAMKARKTVDKEILRVALGEIQTAEAREGRDLDDAAVEKILRKLQKSNRETIAATDNAEQRAVLEQENEVIDALLPKTLSEDEIVAALAEVAEAVRAAANDGQATGVAMKHLRQMGATVDGKTVSAAVHKLRG